MEGLAFNFGGEKKVQHILSAITPSAIKAGMPVTLRLLLRKKGAGNNTEGQKANPNVGTTSFLQALPGSYEAAG